MRMDGPLQILVCTKTTGYVTNQSQKAGIYQQIYGIIGNTGNISNWNGRNKGDGLASG
jgi:hypothetical protein